MQVVLDTNILFAGLVSSQGASYEILSLVVGGELIHMATPALWMEYEEQMASERFRALTSLNTAEVDDILDYLASIVRPVQNDFVWRGILPDDDDAFVVETAFNGNADVLITFNEGHFRSIAGQFSFQIQTPSDFLTTWQERQ